MRRLATTCIVGLALAMTTPAARATAQAGDILIVDGQEHTIHSNPLESLLAATPELRPRSGVISSGLWRGYVATWQLVERELFLVDVEVEQRQPNAEGLKTTRRSVMSEMFPQQPRVFANWYTGYLVVPEGELIEYIHSGYASTFERYTVYTVVEGTLTRERQMNDKEFRKFRKSQFRAYKQTDKYISEFNEFKDEDDTRSEVEAFLFEVSSVYYLSKVFGDDH